jgi:pimeloyl-[acyl-carrier protein] methyl ester esterase
MSLHAESQGTGEQLVMIHGWGMHGGLWDGVVPQLAKQLTVHCVDLPGHGYSNFTSHAAGQSGLELLDSIVDTLSAQFTGPLNVCGWSLGGLVALRWAQLAPQQLQRLVVVASTPCFAEREDWLFGVTGETLQQFSTDLERDHVAMLRRFLTLLVRGGTNERELLADLRTRLFNHGQPDINALRDGLEILRDVDFRAELPCIAQPALLIAGECDKLTPPEASVAMAKKLPNARMVKISGAAHVPFLSEPDFFVEQITDFLHG